MRLEDAKKLKAGDIVNLPFFGIKGAKVVALIEDSDPRIQLLVEIEGQEDPINYKLVQRGDRT